MPRTSSSLITKPRSIKRGHSGCKSCRKRGKKCDETKPRCRACTRLSLDCSYNVDFRFQTIDGASLRQQSATRIISDRLVRRATHPDSPVRGDAPTKNQRVHIFNEYCLKIPDTPASGYSLESGYFDHFQRHVRHLIPSAYAPFTDGPSHLPALRLAVLCISASNLSMLNARVQSRIFTNDARRSLFSPLANNLHHLQAQRYHEQALWYCRTAAADEIQHHAPALLAAHTLLAYYHHASTDHSKFRLAVWESFRFVFQNKDQILTSPDGCEVLQMWYRLCMSHRLSKPPALLIEGEGASSFGPNRFPDAFDHLFLKCILGMSTDDLIYDILIKTMEIRTRLVVFRSVAGYLDISEQSDEIGSIAHGVLNKMLGRDDTPNEFAEAEEGYLRGTHLLGLLDVQRERLKVWRSRLRHDQQPMGAALNTSIRLEMIIPASVPPLGARFPTHRDAMNALYYVLCEIMFAEASRDTVSDFPFPQDSEGPTSPIGDLAHRACQIISMMDFSTSNTSDVYTFSLAETLLQLVLLWRSDAIFHYVLDVVWPQLEGQGRGYEHSHYPTHLVKRIITQMAVAWTQGRVISFAQPAITENITKLNLLDIHHPIDLVVGGHDKDGRHFIEKIPLPWCRAADDLSNNLRRVTV